MRTFGLAAFAAATAALVSCASPQVSNDSSFGQTATNAAAITPAPAPISPSTAVVYSKDFEGTRAALPAYDVQRAPQEASAGDEMSIVRDLTFAPDSSFLSTPDVARLVPLQEYLSANPTMTVLIRAYGDGGKTSLERDADLSLSRAGAVVRALRAQIRVGNKIDTMAPATPQARDRAGSAEIIFVWP